MSLDRNLNYPYEDDAGNRYKFIAPLGNRGQSGSAGFYENEAGKRFVVKEDDIATCIMEGSAGFVLPYLPRDSKSSVNIALVGQFGEINKDKKVVSIQPAIKVAMSLPKAILGQERNPSTLTSMELTYQKIILEFISELSEDAKAMLAAAIFASAFVGDESLHLAQFLVDLQMNDQKDEKNQKINPMDILTIIRIDLGARERYALKRLEEKDFKHDTSKAYSGKFFSQVGNYYIRFLLNDVDVRAKYMHLWIRSADKYSDIKEGAKYAAELSINWFHEALSRVPEADKKEAINKVYKIYAKEYKKSKDQVTQEELEATIREVVSTRVEAMQRQAKSEYYDILKKCDLSSKRFTSLEHHFLSQYVYHPLTNNDNDVKELTDFCLAMNQMLNETILPLNKVDDYYALLAHLHAAVQFRDLDVDIRKNLLENIKLLKERLKSIKVSIQLQERISSSNERGAFTFSQKQLGRTS